MPFTGAPLSPAPRDAAQKSPCQKARRVDAIQVTSASPSHFDDEAAQAAGSIGTTALSLLAEHRAVTLRPIPTFSNQLDAALGGGLPTRGITEVSGPPGVGKTQFAMQVCVSAFLPAELGGLGAAAAPRCLFIDTEGNFSATRFHAIANAAVARVHALCPASDLTVDQVLRCTCVVRAPTLPQFIAAVHALHCANDFRCVVVDSVAFPFRSFKREKYSDAEASPSYTTFSSSSAPVVEWSGGHHSHAARLLHHTTTLLGAVAASGRCPVLLTNHVSTAGTTGALRPCLGEVWAHALSHRVQFAFSPRSHQHRRAIVTKADTATSPMDASCAFDHNACEFIVCEKGIREAS